MGEGCAVCAAEDELTADAALRAGLCIVGRAAQQGELRLAQRFNFGRAWLSTVELVEALHEQARAAIRDGPQTCDDGLCALSLREHGEAFDLFAVRARAARRRVARGERKEFHAAEEVGRTLEVREL